MSHLHPLVEHLLFGDIDEMPLGILKIKLSEMGDCWTDPSGLNEEQQTRLATAATVQAWIEGRLHKGGFIYDPARDKESDRIK